MISQIESKELIGKAYSSGIEYTKPINRLEVISVIRKVSERLHLRRSIKAIQKTLNAICFSGGLEEKDTSPHENSMIECSNCVLSDLGLIGEAGNKNLLDILDYLFRYEADHPSEQEFPQLHDIYREIARKKLGSSASEPDLKREVKATEQRVRRAVSQALNHLASLGLMIMRIRSSSSTLRSFST